MINIKLDTVLQSITNPHEKTDFMERLFVQLNSRVQQILLFGPCNNSAAKKASNIYFQGKENRLFPIKSQGQDLDALPAIIANLLTPNRNLYLNDFEKYLKISFLYGTGTCEFFAIVGAYILATEFNVSLSIETAFADESHTYIRLHTTPEYIFDFWSQMACEYSDTVTWNETLGPTMLRKNSELKINARYSSDELIAMGNKVFTEENQLLRLKIIQDVMQKVDQFKIKHTVLNTHKVAHKTEATYWSHHY